MLTQTNRVSGKAKIPELEPEAVDITDHQRRVTARFERATARWKEIYLGEGVYEIIHQLRRDLVLTLVDKLQLPPQAHVLEIGCGTGFTAVALAQRGYTVNAIDTASGMVASTRQLAVESGVGQRVITSVGDVQSLPFPNDTFALAVAMGVTPFLPALDRPLQETARVLRRGGYLIVSADNRWRLTHILDPRRFPALESTRWRIREALEQLGLNRAQARKIRLRNYSLREFDALLSAVGLDKLEGRTIGFGPFSVFNHRLLPDSAGVKVHHRLQSLADRGFPLLRSAGAQYIVLAKKQGSNRESATNILTSSVEANRPCVSPQEP